MAVGTVTYPSTLTHWGKDQRGRSMRTVFQYAGPSTYVIGGDPITPPQVKLGVFEFSNPAMGMAAGRATAVIFQLDIANQKIVAYWQTGAGAAAALPEVDNGTDLSGYTAQIAVEGRG